MNDTSPNTRSTDDTNTSIQSLRDLVNQFVTQRLWNQFHNPKDLAISISLEANELLEHVQWLSIEEIEELIKNPKNKEEMQDEIADIQIYLLSLCNCIDVDLSTAVHQKIQKNKQKYPVNRYRNQKPHHK